MKHTICHQVRSEIEEKDLTASLSAGALEHLRRCRECQEFQGKETKLRQIVSSLETVAAPPDFDFRLRARLASEGNGASYRSMAAVRVWRMRSAAVAAMLLIFAATIFVIRQNQTVEPANDFKVVAEGNTVPSPARPSESPTTPSEDRVLTQQDPGNIAGAKSNNPRRAFTATSRRPASSIDFGSQPAPVVSTDQNMASMTTFPLDVSQPSFTVSLDDGRGTSRTISVPTVSFGSRRVLNTSVSSNQYAPKGDW
ncbi:MAG TPA: hypothetical protein VLA93_12220 [Pyrinomonadaceae bacterium]|nr:hypothetical protein [Pyrinomonadaceae bacterium]